MEGWPRGGGRDVEEGGLGVGGDMEGWPRGGGGRGSGL